MSDDHKKFTLEVLRTEFMKFMNMISKMPGSIVQKQAAFMRFDEGHMWMQNAVATFEEPAPTKEQPSIPEQPASEPVKDEQKDVQAA